MLAVLLEPAVYVDLKSVAKGNGVDLGGGRIMQKKIFERCVYVALQVLLIFSETWLYVSRYVLTFFV